MSNFNIEDYAYPDLAPLTQDFHWCHKYAYDVLKGNIVANKYIKQAAQRHFDDLQRTDIYFDEKDAKSIVLWFKFIPIVKSSGRIKAGDPTVLLPWQIFFVCSLVAWKHSETIYDEFGLPIAEKGCRRYTQALCLVGRKNGKTTLAAGITLWYLYKGGFNPEAYSAATKKDQSKIVLKIAMLMIKLSPRLRSIFKTGKTEITYPAKEGSFVNLSSDSNTLDGLNPLIATLDECHAVKDHNLYGVIRSAFGAQSQGMFLIITTAGTILQGLCVNLYNNGKATLDPKNPYCQDNYFYLLYQLDKDDDWNDAKTWFKSNPGLALGMPKMSTVRTFYNEALGSIEEKVNFLTKSCNLFVNGADKWLDVDDIRKGRIDDLDVADYKDCNCAIGLDRSRYTDLTSFSVVIPTDDGGIKIFLKNMLPRSTFENASSNLKTIYQNAVERGHLDLVDGNQISNDMVISQILDLQLKFPNNDGFYYDPYAMADVALKVDEDYGYVNMISVSQGAGNMSIPAKQFEALAKDGKVYYNGDTMFEFACSCAIITTSQMRNIHVGRESDKTDKIDPLIATLVALSGITLFEDDRSVYDKRGVITSQ